MALVNTRFPPTVFLLVLDTSRFLLVGFALLRLLVFTLLGFPGLLLWCQTER